MAKVTVKKRFSANERKAAPLKTAPKPAARTKQSAPGPAKPRPAVKTAPVLQASWFWICALYKSERGGKKGRLRKRHLWERRVFVIRAVRGAERRVAREVAEAYEQKYRNASGETVYWRLKEIEAYAELFDKRITSGTEVYWHFFVKVDR